MTSNQYSKSSVEVLSLVKSVSNQGGDPLYDNACNNWFMDTASLNRVFTQSDTITAHEKNYLFNTLPCQYTGVILKKGRKYNFIVNAGSYTVLYDEDSTYYLGYFKTDDIFLSRPVLKSGLNDE